MSADKSSEPFIHSPSLFCLAKHEADGRAALSFKRHFTVRPCSLYIPSSLFCHSKTEGGRSCSSTIQVAFHRPPRKLYIPPSLFCLAKQEADGHASFIIQVAFTRPPHRLYIPPSLFCPSKTGGGRACRFYHSSGISPSAPAAYNIPPSLFCRRKTGGEGTSRSIIQVAFTRPVACTFPLACFALAKQEADGRAALSFKWHFTDRPRRLYIPPSLFCPSKTEGGQTCRSIIQVAFHRPAAYNIPP